MGAELLEFGEFCTIAAAIKHEDNPLARIAVIMMCWSKKTFDAWVDGVAFQVDYYTEATFGISYVPHQTQIVCYQLLLLLVATDDPPESLNLDPKFTRQDQLHFSWSLSIWYLSSSKKRHAASVIVLKPKFRISRVYVRRWISLLAGPKYFPSLLQLRFGNRSPARGSSTRVCK